jgi:hypothetical protein
MATLTLSAPSHAEQCPAPGSYVVDTPHQITGRLAGIRLRVLDWNGVRWSREDYNARSGTVTVESNVGALSGVHGMGADGQGFSVVERDFCPGSELAIRCNLQDPFQPELTCWMTLKAPAS